MVLKVSHRMMRYWSLKKITVLVVFCFFTALFSFSISAKSCTEKEDCYPSGFIPSKCGTFYSCINNQCTEGSNSCVAPDTKTGASGPTAGSAPVCPAGCICAENSISCSLTEKGASGSATGSIGPDTTTGKTAPLTGTCPASCTCTENAISCILDEESPSQNIMGSETGTGSGIERKETTKEIEISKNAIGYSIKSANANAITKAEILVRDKKLYIESPESERHIKIMPDRASEIAIQKLGDLGFAIELKELGNYELTAEKNARILFIIPAKGKVSLEINGETGEVTSIKRPWWSFLASGI